MNVNGIMSNLYGSDSSQNLNHVKLVGGNFKPTNFTPTFIKPADKPDKLTGSSFNEYSLSGGACKKRAKKKGGADATVTLANGTYLDDKVFKKLCNTFCLNWYLTNPRYNALWIVEPEKTVNEYCDKWLKYLESKGIAAGSEAASKLSASVSAPAEGLRYTKCIFDVYSNPNNMGMEYHIPRDFPEIADADLVLRRTNRAGDVCYFKFISANEILCSTSKDFPKGEETVKMKLLARCQQSVFIISGALPNNIIANMNSKAAKANAIYTLGGGGMSKTNALKDFNRELANVNNDIELASYNYLGKQVLAAVNSGMSVNDAVNKYAKYMTGDRVFSAFKLMAGNEALSLDEVHNADPAEVDEAQDMLVEKMKVATQTDPSIVQSFTKHVENMYHNACISKTPTIHFINRVSKAYNDIADFKADIASNYVKRHANSAGVKTAFGLFKAVDDALDGKETGMGMSIGSSSALNDIAFEAISDGIISVNAKSNIPTLLCARANKRCILGSKRRTLKGGADEPTLEEVEKEVKSLEKRLEDDGTGLSIVDNKEIHEDYSDGDEEDSDLTAMIKAFSKLD